MSGGPPEPASLSAGIWISPAEIMALPTSGVAWDTLLAAAAAPTSTPNIADQDDSTDVNTLAKALVGVRLGASNYIDQARANVMAAIGTEAGGRALALGRNLLSYVVTADLVGLSPAEDLQFRAWLTQVLDEELEGFTLRTAHEIRSNNWGTMAGASRAAVAAYLGNQAEIARVAQVFKGWLGDTTSYADFSFDEEDSSWHADSLNLLPLNPRGSMISFHSVDGALPEEMRRGGSFTWPAAETNYPWGALQGAVAQAEVLFRAGYSDVWQWQDRGLLRAVRFLRSVGFDPEGDDQWAAWLIDSRYGTDFISDPTGGPGKNIGWTAWTHQFPTAYPTNQAPLVDAGIDQWVRPGVQAVMSGVVSDDQQPLPANLTFAWNVVGGTGVAAIANPGSLTTTVSFSAPGSYVLRLTASDGLLIDSDDVTIVVDPTPPTVLDVIDVSPDPREDDVNSVRVVFSEPVVGLVPTSFLLTRGGIPIAIPADVAITTDDRMTWKIKGLHDVTVMAGNYSFIVDGPASGITDLAGHPLQGVASDAWIKYAQVSNRYVFYNNSAFDGNSPAAGSSDDLGLATDKLALLPGNTATLANYTSFNKGINGVFVDVAGVPSSLTIGDFTFKVGNSSSTSSWTPLGFSPSLSIRVGAGDKGSDRVTLIWPDGTITKKWLQVTLAATTANGLRQADVFYFGNAVGEAGNSLTDAQVNAGDELLARGNPRNIANPATVDFLYDFNRDKQVNAADQLVARGNGTNLASALRLISPSSAPGSAAQAIAHGELAAAALAAAEPTLSDAATTLAKRRSRR